MKQIIFLIGLLLASAGTKAQLFINEISQGADGNKDYIELVVAGTRSCTDSTMDLRGTIVDDNQGWYGNGSFNAGAFRFPNSSSWSAVPYGSIILIYNSKDKNPAITLSDDPTDANHDYVYVVADSSIYLEASAEPSAAGSSFDYSAAVAGSWAPLVAGSVGSPIGMDDSSDVLSVINPLQSNISASHSVGWGWLASAGTQTPTIQFGGVSGGGVVLYHTGNAPAVQNLWTLGSAAGGVDDETPGLGNTLANSSWIDSMRIQASAPQTPDLISGPASLCSGSTASYTIAAVAGATSYRWSIPGAWTGSSTDTTITLTVTHAGVVGVTAENACGSSAAAILAIAAASLPATPSVIIGSSTVCAGNTETFSVPSIGADSLIWTLPAGWNGMSSGNATSCSVGSAGGTISVIAANVCGNSAAVTLPVIVNAYVAPSVSISTANTTVCGGAMTTFNAASAFGGSAASYQWLINGIPFAVSGPSINVNTLGNGDSISVILSSSEQCLTTNGVSSNQITMNVIPSVLPDINVTALPGNMVCQGATINFTSSINNGGANPSYLWYRNGVIIPGVTSSRYSTNMFNNGDTIYAALISSAVCPSRDTMPGNPIKLRVNPIMNPVVSISASQAMPVPAGSAITFTASYSGANAMPDFQWLKNGAAIPFETADVFTTSNLKANDTISVRMTSNDPCAVNNVVTSGGIRVLTSMSTGINQVTDGSDARISLYPNPSNGQFTINIDWSRQFIGEPATLDILNMMGQMVYHTDLTAGPAGTRMVMSLGEAAAKGMYQLRLRAGNMQATRQLLIR